MSCPRVLPQMCWSLDGRINLCQRFGMKLVWIVCLLGICAALTANAQDHASSTSTQAPASAGTAYQSSIERAPLDLKRLDISPTAPQKKWTLRSLVTHPLKTLQPKKIAGL